MNKSLSSVIAVLLMMCAQTGYAQSVTVSGKVTEHGSGLPMSGVNVYIEGTTTGSSTNLDGEYAITAELRGGEILVFSFIGFRTERVTLSGADQVIDMELSEDATQLEDVVVLGSSVTQSRRSLGNAVTVLPAEALERVPHESVADALQAKVPGAQITQNSGDPAGGFSIRLRGPSTIKGSSEPLYVIDGVVVSNLTTNVTNLNVNAGDASIGQNRMADINPNDIESINVLNGAAAAAIYGSRASNGVVIMTTKKGGGNTDGKPEFYFKTSLKMNELRKRLDLNLTGQEFKTIPNSTLTGRLWPIFGFNPADNSLTPFRYLSTEKFSTTRYDYQDNIFRTSLSSDNYLSARGRAGTVNYFVSGGYLNNQGIIRNTSYERASTRINLNQVVKNWLSYDVGLYYANSHSNEKPDGNVFWSPINSMNITNNTFDITQRDANGNLQAVERTRVNPLSIIETFDITQDVRRIIPSLRVSLIPFKNFTIDQILGIDHYVQEGNIYIPVYPYENVNPAYFNDGYVGTAKARVTSWNYDINATYEADLSSGISLNTTLGYSFQSTKLTFDGEQGRALDASGSPTVTLQTNPLDSRLDIFGTFLQETLSLDDKLFITVAGRVDGATNFDVDKRRNFYPKVSGSYVLVDGSSGKNSFFNSVRLRSSYGEAGNLTAISPFERFGSYTPNDFLGTTTLQQNSRLGNDNLKPERTREFEIGGDASMLNDRVAILASYYQQNIEDLIVSRVLAPSIGGTSRTENVGTMENKGVEVYARFSPIKQRDLSWNVSINFSRNRNKVLKTIGGDITIANVLGAPPVVKEGEPLGIFWGTYFARDDNGNLILTGPSTNGVAAGTPQPERGDVATNTPMRDANGQPTGDLLRKKIGDPNPDFIMGVSTDVKYKNFSFYMLWDAVQGVDVYDADKRTRQGVGLGRIAEQELNGDLPRGYIAGIYPIEAFRISDGSFVKLREISISYRIPPLLSGRLKHLTISLIGRNLFSSDNFFSYDPETNAGGQSNLLRATNFGNVPIPRSFSLSLSTNF